MSSQEQPLSPIRALRELYCSEVDDIGRDFFVPCLKAFSTYDRAAGYFATSALRTWVGGIGNLIGGRNVKIRMIISPELREQDWAALRTAVDPEKRSELFEKGIEAFVSEALLWTETNRPQELELAKLLAWLIAAERLEIRFAFNLVAGKERGIFHKKIGIFSFSEGEKVAFTGSANESNFGHELNSESIDVFRSWCPGEMARIGLKQAEFERCWEPNPKQLLVRSISPQLLDRIKAYIVKNPPSDSQSAPSITQNILDEDCFSKLWIHQKAACKAFLKQSNGVLEMATGTGKTRTAIALVKYLFLSGRIDSAVFSMAGNDLLRQWEGDLRRDLTPSTGVSLLSGFAEERDEQSFVLNPRRKVLLCSRDNLQRVVRQLRRIPKRPSMAIVHDEVHDLGSAGNRIGLAGHREFFEYRLGLSATPERAYDQEGNDFIETEIGPILFQYSLEDAIKQSVLCPFDYTVIPYKLVQEDKADLAGVFARQARAAEAGNPWPEHQAAIEVSRVYKKARQKPHVFASHLGNGMHDAVFNSVIFVEDRQFAEDVYPTIIRYTHKYSQYFDTDKPTVLKEFALGRIDCLITCHKLSQGIDLPSLKNVVLFASQRGQRETIQRLGRCLRRDRNNPAKVAHVLDFRLVDEDGAVKKDGFDEERVSWLTDLSAVRPPVST